MAIKFKYKNKNERHRRVEIKMISLAKKVKILEPFQNALGQTGESTG